MTLTVASPEAGYRVSPVWAASWRCCCFPALLGPSLGISGKFCALGGWAGVSAHKGRVPSLCQGPSRCSCGPPILAPVWQVYGAFRGQAC